MYRLLLFITSLLISFTGFAQAPSDSLQEARKAQIEKARAAARAKAEAKAAERAKMEAEKKAKAMESDSKPEKSKTDAETKKQSPKKAETEKADAKKTEAKADDKAKEEKPKREKRSREEKKEKDKNADAPKKADAPKAAEQKEEKPKKPSIKERNMADTTIAKSKYGPGTYGWRGNVGATIAWSDYGNRENKMGFDSWGFVLNGGMGYRFNHIGYVGLLIDVEAIEMLAFSPMVDFIVSAPTPVAPFVELTAGPYLSYDEYRKWVFQPRFGLSYRGKQNKIMRFGFGFRIYDDAFDSDSFNPQYAASYSIEF